MREERAIYSLKLCFRQETRWTIFYESCRQSEMLGGFGVDEGVPLYHCCNSFLSKCVDLERSSNCAGDNLDCLREISVWAERGKVMANILLSHHSSFMQKRNSSPCFEILLVFRKVRTSRSATGVYVVSTSGGGTSKAI